LTPPQNQGKKKVSAPREKEGGDFWSEGRENNRKSQAGPRRGGRSSEKRAFVSTEKRDCPPKSRKKKGFLGKKKETPKR